METRYIDLLKKVLVGYFYLPYGEYKPLHRYDPSWKRWILEVLSSVLEAVSGRFGTKTYVVCEKSTFTIQDRIEGRDWPAYADTMIGLLRLNNVEYCVTEVLKNGVPGDLIETGVWRGGTVIFMQALLKEAGETHRTVWAADSFEGLPPPNEEKYPADKGDRHFANTQNQASLEEVKRNFEKYGLLDDNVRFLKGWFKDTLPSAPIEKLAVVRLDGDMYESTMDALVHLYPKLSPGGYLIIDDWFLPGCKKAVMDYREANHITEEMSDIDWASVYWKKRS